jgi:hypothetical protein
MAVIRKLIFLVVVVMIAWGLTKITDYHVSFSSPDIDPDLDPFVPDSESSERDTEDGDDDEDAMSVFTPVYWVNRLKYLNPQHT